MRTPFIAGNWKLNLAPSQARQVCSALAGAVSDRGAIDVAIFPTALSIPAAILALEGSGIEVGIQDAHFKPEGAYTGQNSATMARQVGCTRQLVGHSERRHLFGETNKDVNLKVHGGLAAGLLPIICVGETLDEREAGQVNDVVLGQLTAALENLEADQLPAISIAYEPVWAIGTGKVATPEIAQEVHGSIRSWLREHYPAYVADDMRILYGGSVKPANTADLMACPDIDGALVGGASLKADSFAAIVAAADLV